MLEGDMIRITFDDFSAHHSSSFTLSPSFALAGSAPGLEHHGEWHHVMLVFLVCGLRSDHLLSTHWTFWHAPSRLATLILTRYEGFHKAGVAEEMT